MTQPMHGMPCRSEYNSPNPNARPIISENSERCGCQNNPLIPSKLSRIQLLQFINEVSFAVDDILLYLDTHPMDMDAMHYFHKHSAMRNAAMDEYARRFGPLTIDTADDIHSDSWEWVMQPWPWEGGVC